MFKFRCHFSACSSVKQGIFNNSSNEVTLLHNDACEQFTAEPKALVQLSRPTRSADRQPEHSDASIPFLLRNPDSALQTPGFASTFVALTCSYFEIMFFNC